MSPGAFLWIKAFHVIASFAWMAGLLYLPRLFVYHAESPPGSRRAATFEVMERRLAKAIMLPAAIATWILGASLLLLPGSPVDPGEGWFALKFAAVLGLTAVHVFLERGRRAFAAGRNRRSPRFWRIVNEVPTLLLVVAVVAVVVRPL